MSFVNGKKQVAAALSRIDLVLVAWASRPSLPGSSRSQAPVFSKTQKPSGMEGSRQLGKILLEGMCEGLLDVDRLPRVPYFCCQLATQGYCPKLPELTLQVETYLGLM